MKLINKGSRAACVRLAGVLSCGIAIVAFGGAALAHSPDAATQAQMAAAKQRIEQARKEIEAAAQEIAELNAGVNGEGVGKLLRDASRDKNRAMLGVNIDRVLKKPGSHPSPDSQGVRIMGVSPNGPADKAGIKAGDIVIALNDVPLTDASGRSPETVVLDLMGKVAPGDSVTLRYLRDGVMRDTTAVATRFEPMAFAFAYETDDETGAAEGGRLRINDLVIDGVDELINGLPDGTFMRKFRMAMAPGFHDLELATLSPQLGAYFGATRGLLVVSAPDADWLPVQDGDVIVEINGKLPETTREALRLLRGEPGDTIPVQVLRHGQTLTLQATVPPASPAEGWSFRFDTDDEDD